MAGERTMFRWRPGESDADPRANAPLAEQFTPLAGDRAASARELVLEACPIVVAWLRGRPRGWPGTRLARELEEGLEAFARAHGWRGTVARWIGALRGALDLGARRAGVDPRELVLEEIGLWQGGEQGEGAERDWRGEPLVSGLRLPERAAGARSIARGLGRGEVFLVHGWSETIALSLEALFELGLAPRAVLSEGGADLGGRRLARRLASAGLEVELCYDLALFDHLPEADRVWIGSEAIGAGSFLARRGTRALLEEARRLEVASAVVVTSDKVMPLGDLELPSWPLAERWILWEDAPSRVGLDSQTHERVPSVLADSFLTEKGHESAAALALRALPCERATRTGSPRRLATPER